MQHFFAKKGILIRNAFGVELAAAGCATLFLTFRGESATLRVETSFDPPPLGKGSFESFYATFQ